MGLDLNSFSNNENFPKEIVEDDWIAMQATIMSVNIWEYFTWTKLKEENEQSINPNVSVQDVLVTMHVSFGITFVHFHLIHEK
jgi:hypothetical protein